MKKGPGATLCSHVEKLGNNSPDEVFMLKQGFARFHIHIGRFGVGHHRVWVRQHGYFDEREKNGNGCDDTADGNI